MKFETENLLVFPLNYLQLIAYIKNDGTFEKLLKLKKSSYEIPASNIEVLKYIAQEVLMKPEKIKTSIWIIIHKKNKVNVGTISLIGKKRKHSFYEIGYGTEEQFQNQGIMKETIEGFCSYFKSENLSNGFTARTFNDNFASIRVLETNEFKLFKTQKNVLFWKKEFNV